MAKTKGGHLPTEVDYGLVAARISEKRRAEGLGLREAADQCGISYSTLNRLERGTAQPDLQTLMHVLSWLNLSPSSLLMGVQPVRAHLRARPKLDSEVAEAIAEVVRLCQRQFAVSTTEQEDAPPASTRKSHYQRLRSSLREDFAKSFRSNINYDLDTPLNPFDLEVEGVQVRRIDELPGVESRHLRILTATYRGSWSAITLPLNDAESNWLIILNSTHTPERQRATLMEEICHILLGHQLTALSHVEGQTFRDYNRDQEQDAYGLGAAILIPRATLIRRIENGELAETIAKHLGVSQELIEYRIKITGAWYQYKLRQHVKVN